MSAQRHVTLSRLGQQVRIQPTGAALQAYTVDGTDLLDGFGPREEPVSVSGYRGATLVPWPNRVRGGRWDDHGVERQLAVNEPSRDTANHGLAADVEWQVRAESPGSGSPETVTLGTGVGPARGYPYTLDVTVTYALHADGLDVTTTVENRGTGEAPRDAPYGLGVHPYLSLGEERVDLIRIRADAATWLAPADDGIPQNEQPVAGSPLDLRDGVLLGDRRLDDCVGSLARDADGRAWVHMDGTTSGCSVSMWLGPDYRWLMVFTGDALPMPERRRRAVAVEPMTCPPDALRSGRGLLHLEPGEQRTSHWGLRTSGHTSERTAARPAG
ncbi:MAG: aldose 1-epimerase family protein [Actinomycetes bacterium]